MNIDYNEINYMINNKETNCLITTSSSLYLPKGYLIFDGNIDNIESEIDNEINSLNKPINIKQLYLYFGLITKTKLTIEQLLEDSKYITTILSLKKINHPQNIDTDLFEKLKLLNEQFHKFYKKNESIRYFYKLKIKELNYILYKNIIKYQKLVQIMINYEIDFYEQIMRNLGVISSKSSINIKKIKKEEVYPLEYLDLDKNLIIKFNINLSTFTITFKKINNSEIIRIISNNFSRTFNYFLQTLILNILLLNEKIVIRGGFVRDLFVKKNNIKYINLNIYIDFELYDIILNRFYDFIDRHTKELYNIFYLLVSELSKFIFGVEIKLKNILTYNNLTQNINKKCIKLIFEKYENIELSFDISYEYPHNYHLSSKKSSNYEFIINTLQLQIINNKLELSMVSNCKNDYVEKKLQSINLLKYNINQDLVCICNTFLDDTSKVIHMIIQKKTFFCHDICSNYTCKNHKTCLICMQIKKKMYERYKKFNSIYNIELDKCNKKYCIVNAILEFSNSNVINIDTSNNFKIINREYNNICSNYKHYEYYRIY